MASSAFNFAPGSTYAFNVSKECCVRGSQIFDDLHQKPIGKNCLNDIQPFVHVTDLSSNRPQARPPSSSPPIRFKFRLPFP